jgi:RNA polymerase sigma factor (sigma-70 family)
MKQGTDAELIARARKGDQEAFGELVERYRDMVYGLGYHLSGNFEEARDLAQEAFVQAYLKLSQLREAEKFSAWLRQITINLHRMRTRALSLHIVPLEVAEMEACEPESPIESTVRAALEKLRAPERLTLTLHYINGYSQAEIGAFLGVSAVTVKARIARARQRLREEMMQMVEEVFDKNALPKEFREDVIKAVNDLVANLQKAISEEVLGAEERLKRETKYRWRQIIKMMPPELLPRPLGERTLAKRPKPVAVADLPADLKAEVHEAMCMLWFWVTLFAVAGKLPWAEKPDDCWIRFAKNSEGGWYIRVGDVPARSGTIFGIDIDPKAVEEQQAKMGNPDDLAIIAQCPLPDTFREALFQIRRVIPGTPGALHGALYAKMADLIRQALELLPESLRTTIVTETPQPPNPSPEEILKIVDAKTMQVRELPEPVRVLLREAFAMHWGTYVLQRIECLPSWLRRFEEAEVELGIFGKLEGIPEGDQYIGGQYVEVQDVDGSGDGLQTTLEEEYDILE